VDLQNQITFVNPAAAALLGWVEADLIGHAVWQLLHPTLGVETLFPIQSPIATLQAH